MVESACVTVHQSPQLFASLGGGRQHEFLHFAGHDQMTIIDFQNVDDAIFIKFVGLDIDGRLSGASGWK